MEKELASVFDYFAFFGYFPDFNDVYTFFPKKISKKKLKNELKRIEYTPVEYRVRKKISNIKYQISKGKLKNWRFRAYIKLLSLFPQIKLVGLSGSISMMNANLDHDIDLFVITEKNRMFTGRFLAAIISFIMGLKRSIGQKEAPNKVCLNLFFDESNLIVPKFKQTEFVGHEVLQMKPVIVKGNVYERFLEANLWVQTIFPNSSWMTSKIKYQKSKTNLKFKSLSFRLGFDIFTLVFELIGNLFERLLKIFQLILINRHRATEIITNTQLWFHPNDFEKKLKKRSRTTGPVV